MDIPPLVNTYFFDNPKYPGLGIERKYYKELADQGDAKAQCKYAKLACRGEKGEQNYCIARTYFGRSAAQGNVKALYCLAHMAYEGVGGLQNLEEARQCFERVVNNPTNPYLSKLALEKYVEMAYKREGGQINLEEAKGYFEKAADQGHEKALFYYANMLAKENKIDDALKYYELAYKKGSKEALDSLLKYKPDYEVDPIKK